MDIKDIFPLKIHKETTYIGMGEYGFRYALYTNNGKYICTSDYEPNLIEEINAAVVLYLTSEF